jgi:hypothetical protein
VAPHIRRMVNRSHAAARSRMATTLDRLREEHGEGVVSTAIAVLVMAFLGVAMWFAFEAIFESAAERTGEQVDQIGGSGG